MLFKLDNDTAFIFANNFRAGTTLLFQKAKQFSSDFIFKHYFTKRKLVLADKVLHVLQTTFSKKHCKQQKYLH